MVNKMIFLIIDLSGYKFLLMFFFIIHNLQKQISLLQDLIRMIFPEQKIIIQVQIIKKLLKMDKPLLPQKNKSFNQLYEELVLKNQQLKKKNDQYQRLNSDELDPAIIQQIKQDKLFIYSEIQTMKEIINTLETNFKDPKSKNKMKAIKPDCEKQIQRFKRIMQSLLDKSFSQSRNYSKPATYEKDNFQTARKSSRISEEGSKQRMVEVDFQMENKQIEERKQGLIAAEQKLLNVHKVIEEMGKEVVEQGQHINMIDQNMFKARENIESANQQLDEANIQQKKSKKKCVIFVLVIALVAAIVLGVVFLSR